jgi:vacuolar-type H+-ATPase subunit H
LNREAEQKSDKILNDAQAKADKLIQEAEEKTK